MAKLKYYSLDAILEKNAHYNIIIGERSNGKTTAVLRYALQHYCETGGQTAYIRRFEEDIKGGRGENIFTNMITLGYLEKFTGGRWSNIIYRGRAWYLAVPDPENTGRWITDEQPFAYAFALTKQETYKSTAYPNIDTVIFEEFLTRASYGYLTDEFIIFMNMLSTIIRERDNVKIFMLGNTVNKWAPYFSEMGLNHIKDMKKGTIDVYSYGNTPLRVAVEFADFPSKSKPSDLYFAFNNPRLNMITGKGQVWEIDIYPHLPQRYAPKNVLFNYFILFDGEMLHAEIIQTETAVFTYIHRKTTPLQDESKDLLFTPEYSALPNQRRNILKTYDKLGERIAAFYKRDKVFYQDNETGEVMRNYLKWCSNI